MKASINNTLLKSLPTGPVDIYDTKLPGFILRVQKSGRASYRVNYARGKALTIGKATDLKPAEAREQAQKILGDSARGIDPQQQKKQRQAQTLKDYITNVYEPWLKLNRGDGAGMAARLKTQFLPTMGSKPLADVSPWLVEKWRSKRLKEGIKPATINRQMAILKAALNRAVEWGYIDNNPLARVKPKKIDNSAKIRFLSADEYHRLCKSLADREEEARQERHSANQWRKTRDYPLMPDLYARPYVDHVRPLVLLALNTGMRKGEIFNLKWQDVDLNRRELTVEGDGSKSGQSRHIPLGPDALQVLKDWQATTGAESGLVFPARGGGRLDNVRKAWEGILARGGISNFRFHDLRHTFASWHVMGGTDLYVVRDLLGHASIKMTERYAHLAPEHKAAAMASFRPPEIAREEQA